MRDRLRSRNFHVVHSAHYRGLSNSDLYKSSRTSQQIGIGPDCQQSKLVSTESPHWSSHQRFSVAPSRPSQQTTHGLLCAAAVTTPARLSLSSETVMSVGSTYSARQPDSPGPSSAKHELTLGCWQYAPELKSIVRVRPRRIRLTMHTRISIPTVTPGRYTVSPKRPTSSRSLLPPLNEQLSPGDDNATGEVSGSAALELPRERLGTNLTYILSSNHSID